MVDPAIQVRFNKAVTTCTVGEFQTALVNQVRPLVAPLFTLFDSFGLNVGVPSEIHEKNISNDTAIGGRY